MRPTLLLLLAALPACLAAQTPRPGQLVGVLLGSDSTPIRDAVVRATQGPRTLMGRSNAQGVYRVGDLGPGEWTVVVRRLGFSPFLDRLTFDPAGMRRDYVLRELVATLDPVLVAEGWTGVRGIVGDVRSLAPLAGARVTLIGGDTTARTDSAGRFALPLSAGRAVALRVDREGFAPQLLTATVPRDGYLEFDLPLDTLRDAQRSQVVWEDLDRRLRFATPRAAHVGRDELAASDAVRLDAALNESPSLVSRGVIVTRAACVLVDGVPRPGLSVDGILSADVEFVEVYPAGTDLSRTLVLRWPPRAECGSPGATQRGAMGGLVRGGTRRGLDPQLAEFVVVWTRPR